MGFVIPMAVIVFCHIMIYRTVIASRRLAQSGSYDQRLHHKKETKLFKLSIVIVAAFLTAWTPYAVVSFYEAFGKPKNLNPLLSLSAALFAKSGVIWSCVIYISVMDEFRKQATAMVTCIRQKREEVVKQAGVYRNCTRTRKEMLLLKLSIAFVSAFVISWTPYTIVSFYVAYARPEHLDPLLSRSAALVAKSQVLWNPVLYIIIVDGFRRKIFDMLPCKKRNRAATTLTTIAFNNLDEYTGRNVQTLALRQENHKISTTLRKPTDLSINQNQHMKISDSSKSAENIHDIRNVSFTAEKVKENISMTDGQVKNPRVQEIATNKTENIQIVAAEASSIPYEEGTSNIPKTAKDKTVALDSAKGNLNTFESSKGTLNEHVSNNWEGISQKYDVMEVPSNITLVKGASMKSVSDRKNTNCCDPDKRLTKEIVNDHKVGILPPLKSPVNRTAIVNVITEDKDLIPIVSL
ncbi:melanopsin-like [Mercenaria mercenaria]|uniref:melanopsin-like n=1 Tax=Mercenaria mercenaria TaxID=6596 RepID=UPI00234F954C|nr:melanopsin-like [Mercenaria mercenaria]